MGTNRLSDMELDFVSLVPAGDDPMAQVVISKAAPTTEENTMGDPISKDDLKDFPQVVEYIDGLEGEVTDLTKSVEDKDKEIAALTAERDEAVAKSSVSKSAEEAQKEMLEKADPALRAFIEKAQADAKEAQDIAKAERDARLDREFIAKAESMPMVAEDKASFGALLRRMADVLTPEDQAAVEKVLKTADEHIAKGSLFAEFGQGGAETTISKSVEGSARELMKSDPSLTLEQAQAKVYENDPALFAQAMNQEG